MRLSRKRIEGVGEERDLAPNRGDTADPDQIRQLAQQLRESGFDRFSERERRLLTQIAARRHLTRNVNHALHQEETQEETRGDRWLTALPGSEGHGLLSRSS